MGAACGCIQDGLGEQRPGYPFMIFLQRRMNSQETIFLMCCLLARQFTSNPTSSDS